MRHLKRLSAWSDIHPLASMAIGWIVLAIVILAFVPADPPYLNQTHYRSNAT